MGFCKDITAISLPSRKIVTCTVNSMLLSPHRDVCRCGFLFGQELGSTFWAISEKMSFFLAMLLLDSHGMAIFCGL